MTEPFVITMLSGFLLALVLVIFAVKIRIKTTQNIEEIKKQLALMEQAKNSCTDQLEIIKQELAGERAKNEEMHAAVLASQRTESTALEKFAQSQAQLRDSKQALSETTEQLKINHELRINAEADAKKAQEILETERTLLAEARVKLHDAFKSLAATALEGNNKQFLDLAQQYFKRQSDAAEGDLKERQQAIENLVKPLKETVDRYQVHLRELETQRQKSYTTIEGELKKVIETGLTLSSETRALKDALKKPHVRGRWGEIQLKNCVELAGMSEYADVSFQDINENDDGQRLIPDMTVKMPGGRIVIVDSKAPLDAFIAALEASTEEERTRETLRHGRQVKEHIKKLSGKAYQDNLAGTADFTVMFLPNESFLYAALESEPDLVEFGLQKKILVATPPTFVGLLKVIRYGWNEEKLARNAMEISEAGKEMHKRLVDFVESFEDVGRHLERAKREYDKGFARLNSRVLVQARKLETLGVKSNKELPEGLGYDIRSSGIDSDAVQTVIPMNAGVKGGEAL